jgi:hypothetical protein
MKLCHRPKKLNYCKSPMSHYARFVFLTKRCANAAYDHKTQPLIPPALASRATCFADPAILPHSKPVLRSISEAKRHLLSVAKALPSMESYKNSAFIGVWSMQSLATVRE